MRKKRIEGMRQGVLVEEETSGKATGFGLNWRLSECVGSRCKGTGCVLKVSLGNVNIGLNVLHHTVTSNETQNRTSMYHSDYSTVDGYFVLWL